MYVSPEEMDKAEKEAKAREEAKESYIKLKEALLLKDMEQKVGNFEPALQHIKSLEEKMVDQEKEIEKYKDFFLQLASFLPKEYRYDRDIRID